MYINLKKMSRKNELQEYCQAINIDLPIYDIHHDQDEYLSSVLVQGRNYFSKDKYISKTQAEQSAAAVALDKLIERIKLPEKELMIKRNHYTFVDYDTSFRDYLILQHYIELSHSYYFISDKSIFNKMDVINVITGKSSSKNSGDIPLILKLLELFHTSNEKLEIYVFSKSDVVIDVVENLSYKHSVTLVKDIKDYTRTLFI